MLVVAVRTPAEIQRIGQALEKRDLMRHETELDGAPDTSLMMFSISAYGVGMRWGDR